MDKSIRSCYDWEEDNTHEGRLVHGHARILGQKFVARTCMGNYLGQSDETSTQIDSLSLNPRCERTTAKEIHFGRGPTNLVGGSNIFFGGAVEKKEWIQKKIEDGGPNKMGRGKKNYHVTSGPI